MQEQNNGQTKVPFKEYVKRWCGSVKTFFKDFKWDKAHVSVLLKFFLEAFLFAFIITLDLTLKDYLFSFVREQGGHYTLIEGFIDLTYSENTGMGFGLFKNGTIMLTVITAIVIVLIMGYLLVVRKDKAYIRIPLILIAAGGIGNLVDRIAFGYVRDFFQFTFVDFAIFNVADACITVGAVVLIIGLLIMLFTTSKNEWKPEQADGNSAEISDAAVADNSGSATDNANEEGTSSTTSRGNSAEDAADGERSATADGADAYADGKRKENGAAFSVTQIPEDLPHSGDDGDAEDNPSQTE